MIKELKPKKCKSLCGGCYNNDYNFGLGGAKECWSFKGAKIKKRLPIPNDMRPPYDKNNARYMMSCYTKKGYITVDPKTALNSEGYWKS